MAKYEKWLGASLGWVLTGNPIGGLLGFVTGALLEKGAETRYKAIPSGVSEFELNLMILGAYLIKIDGPVNDDEITFTQKFLNTHFDEKHAVERSRILNHCLHKDYDLNMACEQIRMYTAQGTRIQVIRFLFDVALSDGELNERENYFIFRIAGYLNVNDVDFNKIKTEQTEFHISAYDLLGVHKEMTFTEIRNIYRKLVPKYHPDRNKAANETEKKNLARKFQQVQEAYQKIKAEKES